MFKQDSAEALALQALAWIANNPELLPVFMGATGASAEDLRRGATDPVFLGAILDFLLMDDAWVMEFCQATGLRYDAPMQARAALPGGQQEHWT